MAGCRSVRSATSLTSSSRTALGGIDANTPRSASITRSNGKRWLIIVATLSLSRGSAATTSFISVG